MNAIGILKLKFNLIEEGNPEVLHIPNLLIKEKEIGICVVCNYKYY
jgi:hypothetical protein